MSTDTNALPRRRRGTPRDTTKATTARWSPEGRARTAIRDLTTQPSDERAKAIRALVEAAPPLTVEQLDALRPIFARPTAKGAVAA